MLVKVPGTSFVRDTNTMALINVDSKEKIEYQNKVRMMQSQKEEINNVREEINSVKDDVKEIKELILKLLENKGS
jgi:hypothetical protein